MESTMPAAGVEVQAQEIDLVEAIAQVLRASPQPLTAARIRAALQFSKDRVSLDHVTEILHRQAAAGVFVLYPRYRSPRERFWDRPLRFHVEYLIRQALLDGPMFWSAVRGRLPEYAKVLASSVLEEQLAKGALHRHPPMPGKKGQRLGLEPPDPRVYLRPELAKFLARFVRLGFPPANVREGLFDLLREQEWAPDAPATEPRAGELIVQ